MPAAQYEYDNFVSGNVITAVSTEGIICTSRPVSSGYAGSSFGVLFAGIFTAGAGTTAVTFRIREGSLTGTLIYTATGLSIAAAQVVAVTFATIDNIAGEVAGQLWVLTAQQIGGTGSGGLTNGYSSITVPV